MKTKLLLLAAAAAVCLLGAPTDASADHIICRSQENEWALLQTGGNLSDVTSFRGSVAENAGVCPTLMSAVDQRLGELTSRQAERERLRAEAAQSQAAREELASIERTLQQETAARRRAEREILNLRRVREAEAAQAQIPGRPRNLVACLISQDVARMDRGNIPGMQIENLNVPPEIQVVYDIADAAQGAIDVYGWDLTARQWTRNRVAASREGSVLTIGATTENEQNARIRARETINLDTMSQNGMGYFEPITSGAAPAINVNNGQANLNVGALFQRAPRLWLETRGSCAYQNGAPPGPLTGTPSWRVTVREIPTIPQMPRR